MNLRKLNNLIGIAKSVFAWLLSLVVLVPFCIVIFNAFKTSNEAINMSIQPPAALHWENFKTVWQVGSIPQSYLNSFLLSSVSVFLSVVMSSMCAFVLVRNAKRLHKFLYILFTLGLMLPVNMVAVVKVLNWLNLYNTRLGAILLFTGLIMPFSVFLFHGFIDSIPKEMDEAASVDSAGTVTLFFRIILPMLKPVTVTVIIINFLSTWSDFSTPLYILPDPAKAVIVQQVYNFYGTFTASWNLVSVTILYAIVPILIVYAFGQKYIISGMSAGAIKG